MLLNHKIDQSLVHPIVIRVLPSQHQRCQQATRLYRPRVHMGCTSVVLYLGGTPPSPLLGIKRWRDQGLMGPPLDLGTLQVPIYPIHPPRGPRRGVRCDGEHVLLALPVQLALVKAVDRREVGISDDPMRRLGIFLDPDVYQLRPRWAHSVKVNHNDLSREVTEVFFHYRLG